MYKQEFQTNINQKNTFIVHRNKIIRKYFQGNIKEYFEVLGDAL